MKLLRSLARLRGPRMLLALMIPVVVVAGCDDDPEVVEEPELITAESPFRYPVAQWDNGEEGETVIMVRVTETGTVDSVYVLESSGYAAFDSAAVHGARDLRFQPGRHDQKQVAMWARLPVRFHMSDPAPQAGATP